MPRNRISLVVMLIALTLVLPLVGTVALTGAGSPANAQRTSAEVQERSPKERAFPGHRPGKTYLGMSCGEECPSREAHLGTEFGLKRWFKKWGNWRGVAEAIKEDRQRNRRTWISIEGPSNGAAQGWLDVARGRYDGEIRQLAAVLRSHDSRPVFLSFDHEMSAKAPDSQGKWWTRGFVRFHDVLRRANALRNVALVPIQDSWLFSPFNEDKPARWLSPGVLRRSDFLAVDVYQDWKGVSFATRIKRVDRWLGNHGHPHMKIGVGEMGATQGLGGETAASWLNRALSWSAKHRNMMVALAYFNTTANSKPGVYWPLDETAQKADVYRSWLKRSVFIQRVG